MRRPMLVGVLAAAVTAVVASTAVAVGTLDGPFAQSPDTGGQGQISAAGMTGGPGMVSGQGQISAAGMTGGPGMVSGQAQGSAAGMTGGQAMMGGSMMSSMRMVWLPGDGVAVHSIPAARARAATAGKPAGLHPGEVMWFANGFYVELKDRSGQAATEVIVDPVTGAVSTEPGPAMMWNTRFSMMGTGSRSGGGGAAPVSATKARGIAGSWLAANRPGTTIASIDAYPGYFTIDVRRNGAVSGMMSVSSTSGAPWYHSWHGAFIAMEDR